MTCKTVQALPRAAVPLAEGAALASAGRKGTGRAPRTAALANDPRGSLIRGEHDNG